MVTSTSSGANALPPDVQLTFRDDLTQPELRRVVERSVATLAARARDQLAAARAAQVERARLVAALNAQYKEQTAAGPELAKALEDVRKHPLIDPGPGSAARREPAQPAASSLADLLGLGSAQLPRNAAIEVTVPPNYHFFWSWSVPGGGGPFGAPIGGIESVTGFIGIDVRSGSVEGGADGFVETHAGYGLNLRTDHTVRAVGRALKRVEFVYNVHSVADASATTEGGLELTALEDGVLLDATPRNGEAKIWRQRVSGLPDEEASDHQGPYSVFEPRELAFTMNPGHDYTFNVGAWVFSDVRVGAGWAAARSLIKADIFAITIER